MKILTIISTCFWCFSQSRILSFAQPVIVFHVFQEFWKWTPSQQVTIDSWLSVTRGTAKIWTIIRIISVAFHVSGRNNRVPIVWLYASNNKRPLYPSLQLSEPIFGFLLDYSVLKFGWIEPQIMISKYRINFGANR